MFFLITLTLIDLWLIILFLFCYCMCEFVTVYVSHSYMYLCCWFHHHVLYEVCMCKHRWTCKHRCVLPVSSCSAGVPASVSPHSAKKQSVASVNYKNPYNPKCLIFLNPVNYAVILWKGKNRKTSTDSLLWLYLHFHTFHLLICTCHVWELWFVCWLNVRLSNIPYEQLLSFCRLITLII